MDSDMSIPVLNTEASAVEMLNHNYSYLKADYMVFNAGIRADHTVGKTRYGLFAELHGGMTICTESEQETRLTLKLGMTF